MKHRYLSAVGGLLLAALSLTGSPVLAQGLRLDPTFQPPQIVPVVMPTGQAGVRAVVQQPDGKYIIGGSFSSINGVRVRNLARLHANGTLDQTFSCAASGVVQSLALQPDGYILVGGRFDSLAGAARPNIGRLLPSGALDAGFAPSVSGAITQMAVLPGGDVLALRPSGASQYNPPTGLYRLSGTTGQPVAGFQQAVEVLCFAVQPDGKILIGGGGGSYVLMHLLARLLPDGRLDPSFTPVTTYFTAATLQVAQHTNGTVYYNSEYDGLRGPIARAGRLNSFALQPNGRVLLMPQITTNQELTTRILPSGQVDASYQAANGPRATAAGEGGISATLVQPDGAIVYAGSYTLAGTTPVWGLARFLDANVLTTRASTAAGLAVWPNPAADALHLRFEAGRRPQRVTLVDAMGRVVRQQAVGAAAAELTLDVAGLAAGAYVVRVDDAQAGPATQRVVLAR